MIRWLYSPLTIHRCALSLVVRRIYTSWRLCIAWRGWISWLACSIWRFILWNESCRLFLLMERRLNSSSSTIPWPLRIYISFQLTSPHTHPSGILIIIPPTINHDGILIFYALPWTYCSLAIHIYLLRNIPPDSEPFFPLPPTGSKSNSRTTWWRWKRFPPRIQMTYRCKYPRLECEIWSRCLEGDPADIVIMSVEITSLASRRE